MARYEYAKKDILNVVQGDGFERTFQYSANFVFTGLSFRAQVRKNHGNSAVVLNFTEDDDTLVVDALNRTVKLVQKDDDMFVATGKHVYAVVAFSDTTEDQTTQMGIFEVVPRPVDAIPVTP